MYEYACFHRLSYLLGMNYSSTFKGFYYTQVFSTKSYFLDIVTNRILFPRKNNDILYELKRIRESSYEK